MDKNGAILLPTGDITFNKSFADIVWKFYRLHCKERPYKVPMRSFQFRSKNENKNEGKNKDNNKEGIKEEV